MSAPAEPLAYRTRDAEGEPDGALVLLHGRATVENDLFGILDILDPHRRLVGLTVRGPLSLPPGGRHWYVVPRVGYPDPTTFLSTLGQLSELLDGLPDMFGVDISHTVIGGFSQGSVMAYALGLAAGRPSPAGILAMSGFIPTVPSFELDLASRRGLPVAIAHGSLDPVISVQFARQARDRLEAAGLDVTYHESAMAHSIDPRVIPDLQRWVATTLASTASPPRPTTS
jgi:phospholipase/carboxylesterase